MTIMHEGNLHEGDVVERLRQDGWTVSRQQEELYREFKGFGSILTGHIDGVVQLVKENESDPPCLLEIKSMGDDSFKAFKSRGWNQPGLIYKYKWQTSFYMICLGMPMMFVVKNRNSGEIYTDFVREPFYSWSDIVSRIAAVETAARNNDIPVECEWSMYPCPFNYLHEEEVGDEDYIPNESVTKLFQHFIERRDERDGLVAEVKELATQIKEATKGRKVSLPFATGYESVARRVTYDIEKMRGDGIDVDHYEIPNLQRTYTVKKKKVKNAGDSTDSSTVSNSNV